MVIVCNNLCEEVDSLLAVEVTIAEEGSARSREAHHRQRHRDRHVHLDGRLEICQKIYTTRFFRQELLHTKSVTIFTHNETA